MVSGQSLTKGCALSLGKCPRFLGEGGGHKDFEKQPPLTEALDFTLKFYSLAYGVMLILVKTMGMNTQIRKLRLGGVQLPSQER